MLHFRRLSLFTGILLASCLLSSCQKERVKKRRVVYVDSVGDLFHSGHVHFLAQAKAYGDYLIVGLISDEDAESYNKRKPIMSLAERVEMAKQCKYVDEVIAGCPYRITDELIDQKKIDLVLHGDDYGAESLYYYYQAAMDRGIFKTIPYTIGISTSELIDRVIQRSKERPLIGPTFVGKGLD